MSTTSPSTTRSSVPALVHHLASFDRWYVALAQGIKTYELRRTVRAGDEDSGIRPGWALLSIQPTAAPRSE